MDLGLAGKVAVVTGGSSGIGLETARLFLADGCKVVVCGRDRARLDTAAAALAEGSEADRLAAIPCDVLDPDAVAKLREGVLDRFGRVDILINNAGQARVSSFETTSDQDWRDELELKFFSVLHPTRAFLPDLEKAAPSAIVCTSALLARRPEGHLFATSAARAGTLNLVKNLSREIGPKGIRINSILIGLVDSGQWARRYEALEPKTQTREEWYAALAADRGIPLGRLGRTDEAAKLIVFLASPAAGYITGSAVEIAGGQGHHV